MPKRIRRQVIAFEDKRRFERVGIMAITGADSLQGFVVRQAYFICEPEGESARVALSL